MKLNELPKIAIIPSYTEAKISKKGFLNKEDLRGMFMNVLTFTAPALVVFFTQLALGAEFKVAGLTALLIFWGLLADYFKKLNNGKSS